MSEIQKARFAIDETPYCLWDLDIRQRNLDFINKIDPHYFEHIANLHGGSLEGWSSPELRCNHNESSGRDFAS
jgi:hypothetical protein